MGWTAWHLAAEKGNLEELLGIWEWAEEKLTSEEINNNFLLGTDNEGKTAFHLASVEGNLEVLYELWELAKKKLNQWR
jgi:ankyrin repeat protein